MDRIIWKVQFHTFLAIFDRFNFDQVWPAVSCLAFYNNVLSVLHILWSSILISYSVLFMFFMIVIRLRVKMWILSRFPRSASLSIFALFRIFRSWMAPASDWSKECIYEMMGRGQIRIPHGHFSNSPWREFSFQR